MKLTIILTGFLAIFTLKVIAQKADNKAPKAKITEVVLLPPPPQIVSIKEVSKHVNEYITVIDKVYTTRLFEESNMTLLNLGADYPNQLLTVMIKGEDRDKFADKPEVYFKGRVVSVTGKVIDYKGKPEIIVSDPKLLKLELADNPLRTQKVIIPNKP